MVYIGQKIRSKNNTQEHLQHLQIYIPYSELVKQLYWKCSTDPAKVRVAREITRL